MPKKYYAVKAGIQPGIYQTWEECKEQLYHFPNAVYKGFMTRQDAENYLQEQEQNQRKAYQPKHPLVDKMVFSIETIIEQKPYAFVDGSFNIAEWRYGCGGFLVYQNQRYPISASGTDEEMATMRNVAGEILGSRLAVEKAIELQLDELYIFFFYVGIEHWANQTWKANKKGTIAYQQFIQEARRHITLYFVKVKAHSGIPGNEEADQLAKQAVHLLEIKEP